jgi:phosphatidate cytidylyltransferase
MTSTVAERSPSSPSGILERDRSLNIRLIVGTLLALGVVGILWLDRYLNTDFGLCVAVSVLVFLALQEFYAMVESDRVHPQKILGGCMGICLVIAQWWGLRRSTYPLPAPFDPGSFMICVLIFLTLWQASRQSPPDLIHSLAATLFGVFYIGFLLSYLLKTRYIRELGGLSGSAGFFLVALTVSCAKGSDIFAYLFGRKFGRHRLAPKISPKKTWEGAIAGVAGSIGIALTGTHPALALFTTTEAIVFGTVIGIAAELGDLAESLLKRDARVKDSGALLPAFGGALDLVDCLLISSPTAYYLTICMKQF